MAGFSRAPFRRLTEAELDRPTVVPLTASEKQFITMAMGKPPRRGNFLEKHMALSMPNLEAGWATDYGEEAVRAMVRSMFFEGKPTAHWVFV